MPTALSSRKALTVALLATSLVLIVCTVLYSPFFRQYTTPAFRPPISQLHSCPPEAYAAGNWTRKPDAPVMKHQDDVLEISGFEGCASTREVTWHLGVAWPPEEEAQKLQWRGNASAYEWMPGQGCNGYSDAAPEVLLRQLIEDGGWLLLGDSITEGHFFSLSCLLYPHVRATPDYSREENWYWDRAWPQNLYLNPTSPLLPLFNYPEGFEIDKTPLVTFRRVDLLLGKSDLNTLYSRLHPHNPPETIFSDEQVWDLDPATYLPQFLAPLPAANYRTLVVSTAGHWTTTVFSALRNEDDSKSSGNGLRELLSFFRSAMELWTSEVTTALQQADETAEAEGRMKKERQVVVRAYLHGHVGCHEPHVELGGVLDKYAGIEGTWYNWNWIRRFNDVFHEVVARRAHPNIHFLPIDMPGLLRPEGHVQGDCLHTLTGSGIMEGWSRYISYFVSKLP